MKNSPLADKNNGTASNSSYSSIHSTHPSKSASSTESASSAGLLSSSLKKPKRALTWEELRRDARALENEIDAKLISFGKLGASFSSEYQSARIPSANTRFVSMSTELSQLLSRLQTVNDSLSTELRATQQSTTNASMPSSAASLFHTLTRHRDILRDYQLEFAKTKSNIEAARDRENLLGSVRDDIVHYKGSLSGAGSGSNSHTSLLLQEHDHIESCERLLDDQLSLAHNIKTNLRSQHSSLKSTRARVVGVISKLPGLNNLVHRINLLKRRDAIVLSSVLSLCLVFLLWYLVH